MTAEDVSPQSVVEAFIRAMNEWELEAWELSRRARDTADPGSHWPEVRARFDSVFAKFCTTRSRPYGREASFQRPPAYDPQGESVVGTVVAGRRAYVETERMAALAGGTYRYTLHRSGERWLIDNVKRKDGDRWVREVL